MAGSRSNASRGKQRIEIQQILNEERRVVTFSKRKGGIFKKANELSILAGCGVFCMINSPSGKPFAFVNDSVEKFHDLINGERGDVKKYMQAVMMGYGEDFGELLERYNRAGGEMNENKKVLKVLEKVMEGTELEKGWWSVDISTVRDLEELQEYQSRFKKLRVELLEEVKTREEKKANKD